MAIPNLQVALDHNRIEDALKDALALQFQLWKLQTKK